MAQVTRERVPLFFMELLEIDKKVTKCIVEKGNNLLVFRSMRLQYRALEVSCHGIPWLAFWIAFTWLFNDSSLIQLQVNMLLGLLLDIIVVAVCKAYFRRRRPSTNQDDALGQMGPDVFSFPSGHCSRAVLVLFFFTRLWPVPMIFVPPMLAWVFSICASRILMQRHYLLDIVGGILLGLLEGGVMDFLWLSEDSAKYVMSYLSDEKIDGGDYHV
ncbi:phospholipid phosphatase 6 [Coccinella septempunctata]|uniref:phospholipid phosphatase 6 n=1 Tax=Coccinella septempunctata TaxID=41139 RepID=UPI001D096334|nr:phospholipid phosphatase 6 [Coccinella septempunctata]